MNSNPPAKCWLFRLCPIFGGYEAIDCWNPTPIRLHLRCSNLFQNYFVFILHIFTLKKNALCSLSKIPLDWFKSSLNDSGLNWMEWINLFCWIFHLGTLLPALYKYAPNVVVVPFSIISILICLSKSQNLISICKNRPKKKKFSKLMRRKQPLK